MQRRLQSKPLSPASLLMIVGLLLIYGVGVAISVRAMLRLPAGKETGPLGDVYPLWTVAHFSSALVFAVLAMLQIVPVVRRRYPKVHRISGRIAVVAGLVAAVAGTMIPLGVPDRPFFWRVFMVGYCILTAVLLVRGFAAARRRDYSDHRAWMIRAIAAEGAIITERAFFPIFPLVFGIHGELVFWIYFSCSMGLALAVNLLLAERWIQPRPRLARADLKGSVL
jgi:uncharacterized membrane protein YozB (DUF420 family)